MQTLTLADGGTLAIAEDFLGGEEADNFFTRLRADTPWQQKPGIFGHKQPRLTASYGDPGLTYHYSGTVNPALPWTPELLAIKNRIEAVQGRYNFCLLNCYRSGADSVGLHADNEPGIGDTIASLSLGATRLFRLRHNTTRETLDFQLAHGTLLIMGGTLQQFWKHEVPKTARPIGERINLTFRWISSI